MAEIAVGGSLAIGVIVNTSVIWEWAAKHVFSRTSIASVHVSTDESAYHLVLNSPNILRMEILCRQYVAAGLTSFRCRSLGSNVSEDALRVSSDFDSRIMRKDCPVNIDQCRGRLRSGLKRTDSTIPKDHRLPALHQDPPGVPRRLSKTALSLSLCPIARM